MAGAGAEAEGADRARYIAQVPIQTSGQSSRKRDDQINASVNMEY